MAFQTMSQEITLSAEGVAGVAALKVMLASLDAELSSEIEDVETVVTYQTGTTLSVNGSGEATVTDANAALSGLSDRPLSDVTVTIGFDSESIVDSDVPEYCVPSAQAPSPQEGDDTTESESEDDDTSEVEFDDYGDGAYEARETPSGQPARIAAHSVYHIALHDLSVALEHSDSDFIAPHHFPHAEELDYYGMSDEDIYNFISGALSRLFGRKGLVDRKRLSTNLAGKDGHSRSVWHYTVNTPGQQELERLDSPDRESALVPSMLNRGYSPDEIESDVDIQSEESAG